MDEIAATDIESLARVAGLALAPERLEVTAAVLAATLEAARSFDAVDLQAVEPASTFSAAWD